MITYLFIYLFIWQMFIQDNLSVLNTAIMGNLRFPEIPRFMSRQSYRAYLTKYKTSTHDSITTRARRHIDASPWNRCPSFDAILTLYFCGHLEGGAHVLLWRA